MNSWHLSLNLEAPKTANTSQSDDQSTADCRSSKQLGPLSNTQKFCQATFKGQNSLQQYGREYQNLTLKLKVSMFSTTEKIKHKTYSSLKSLKRKTPVDIYFDNYCFFLAMSSNQQTPRQKANHSISPQSSGQFTKMKNSNESYAKLGFSS